MTSLSAEAIGRLLAPFVEERSPDLLDKLSTYLELLMRWNAKTNLTAVRDASEIVTRHFGESLFASRYVAPTGTLLDFGSGAGFPGLPITLAHPNLAVTLAESQNKKASFLREAIRVLGLPVEVWPARVESMPEGRQFDCVTLRAVDRMHPATVAAARRASSTLIVLTTSDLDPHTGHPEGFVVKDFVPIPAAVKRAVVVFTRC